MHGRKILAAVFTAALLLTSACGGGNDSPSGSPGQSAAPNGDALAYLRESADERLLVLAARAAQPPGAGPAAEPRPRRRGRQRVRRRAGPAPRSPTTS